MTEPNEQSPERVDQFIIFAGYGEVVHRLQVLELGLWRLLAMNIKAGSSLDQAIAKVEKWDSTTLGQLLRGMKTQTHWPPPLLDKLLHAVEVRNYLAHHFLREYFMVEHSEHNRETAAQQLADLSVWLDELLNELDAHVASQGVASPDELDEETQAEIDALRPKDWFGFVTGDG